MEISRKEKIEARDTMFGTATIYKGYCAGFFDNSEIKMVWNKGRRLATGEETIKMLEWDQQLKETVRRPKGIQLQSGESNTQNNRLLPTISWVTTPLVANTLASTESSTIVSDSGNQVSPVERPLLASLNEEQRWAHNIVAQRLQHHMAGE